jgi:hypothetical protein
LVFKFGNFVTFILVIKILVGINCVEQSLPVKPCGQSQPQSALDTPPFKQGVGVQGTSSELD